MDSVIFGIDAHDEFVIGGPFQFLNFVVDHKLVDYLKLACLVNLENICVIKKEWKSLHKGSCYLKWPENLLNESMQQFDRARVR